VAWRPVRDEGNFVPAGGFTMTLHALWTLAGIMPIGQS
jgi:hypothetical protein